MFAETRYTRSREDAEDISLMFVELWRGLPAVYREIFSKKRLDTSQAEMSKARTIVEKRVNALEMVSFIAIYQSSADLHPVSAPCSS